MIDRDDCNNQVVDDTCHHQAGNNRSSSECIWPLPPPTQPPTLDLLSNTTRWESTNKFLSPFGQFPKKASSSGWLCLEAKTDIVFDV